ncbi:MAG: hypothetical protein J6A49_02615 [Clostridia bacterium]|nr:hypothetical protein [Clostridia bacterium]
MSYQDLKRKYKNNIENNEEKKSYENLKGEYYSSSVDDNYIKSFISDSRGFLSKASKDYDTLKYGNARSLYGDKQNIADELNTRAKRIRSVLNHNKDKYAEQDYNDLIKYLDAYDTDSKNIINAFKSKSDYFGQWENEESYNYWTEQEEKRKKYSSMTDDELETEIERLKESKKGNAFTNFAMKFVGAQQEVNSNTNLYSKGVSNEEHNQNVDFDISLINNEKNNRKYKQIDALPDNVKSLINEYTALDRTKEEESLEDDVMLLVNQLSGTSGNYNLDKGSTRRTEIAKELEALGVDNWQELVEYNRIRSDEEYYRPVKERFKEDATEHPVLSSLTTIPASAGKFMGSVKTIESALQGGDAPINPNSPYFMMNDYVNTTRQTVMDNYDWNGKITNIDWFDQLYSTAMSAGDSVFASSFGGSGWVGGSVLGISAMSDTAQEIALNGGSKEQALLTGLLAGVNEMLWEKISLGNFNALKEKGIKNLFSKNGLKTAVGNVLKSAGINFSEELNTEAANLIVDYLVNGGAGSYAQAYQAYRSAGYSDTDSRSKARVDMIKQVGEAGFSGALQGLFMGGGGTAIGAGAQKSAYNTAAKNMTEDEITALQEQARGLGMNEKDIDVGSAGPWGEAPSTKKVANLIGAVDEAQTESEKQKIIDTAKSYGLNVSLYNTKTETGLKDLKKSIANIEKEITATVNDEADNIYRTAIADRIEELGESRGKALYIADSYMRIVDGKTLDQYREAALNSKAAEKAIKEYNSYGEDTPQWVVEAKQKVENVYKDIEKRFIKPVNNDSKAESNDNSNVKSTEKGIDNTVKTLNNAQIPVASAVVGGENTQIEGIGTVSEKGATVIADGKEVDIKNVKFDNPLTAAAYNFASSMETSEKAKAALSLYNPKLDRSTDFRTAFNEYYNAGLKGIGSFNDVDKYYTFAHSLPASWREGVFNAGRSNKVYESGVNKLYKNRNLSKNQKGQLKVLDLLGKKYGISFLVFDSLDDNNGALNGLQIAGTNKVAVSLDADGKLYLRTAGHECFHIIEEWNPKAAAELTEKIINYLKQSEGYNYVEQVKRYAKTYGVDETTADGLSLIHSEMAADSMFDVFSNEKFVKDIVTENRTLAQKIKGFLTDLISELREMINHFHASEEMNALRSQTTVLEDINSSFISALDTATKSMKETLSDKTKNTATKDGVRYSLRRYSDKQMENWRNSKKIVIYENDNQFRSFIKEALEDERLNKKLYFGAVPTELATLIESKTGINVEGFNCSLSAYEIRKIFKDHGNEKTEALRGQRAITENDIINIPIVIQAPESIVLSSKQYMGKPVINMSKNINGKMTIAAVVSDKHLDLFVQTAYVGIKKGNLVTPIAEQAAINTPEASSDTVSDNIIRNSSEKVNENLQNRRSIKLTQKSQRTLDENPELKNVLQDLQHELSLTKGFVPEGKVIHKYAAKLKKDNPCSMNVAEIESDLREIYSVLSSMSGSEGYEYAADLTLNLAKKMLDSSRVLDDLNAEKKELRQKLTTAVKGHKWYLSPEMRAEIEYHYDSYGNFHKKTFGKGFSFSENSTDYLDSDWSELCAAVPELLDSDTPAVEQPLAIVEAFSATEYEYGLFDDYQYDSQAKYIATDIMNNLAAVPEADTLVGKIKSAEYDRIARLKSENAEKISELKKKYAEDIERTALEEKTRYKLQIKQKLESEKAAKARKSIETTMVRLSDMLAHGTKSRHIPLKLIDTVRDLCYSITLNRASQAKLGDNLNKVEALYAALNEGKDGVDGEPDNQFLKNAYDEYVHNLIHQLNTQLRHKSIGDMTLEELILVDETVKAVAQRVIRGNELHIESKNEGVEETAQAISGELGMAKVKRYYKTDALNKTSDKFDLEKWKFLKPVYAWRMIGSETFSELMNNIRKGEDTWAVDIAEAREKILSIGGKYHKDTWADDKKELTLESGDTFTFSIQQLMMLYVASQREQYIPHLIGHKRGEKTDSMKGGFVFEDAYKVIEDRKGNSKGAKTRAWRKRDAGTHHLTESDLDLFAETLTAEQKAYANEMRDYLAKGLAVKGNEITRQLYDMNKFVEDKYFPIKVAREFLDGTMKEPEVRSVLSTSVMKDLQENANNPILLRNFDDMWAEHVQQMAMFHSFALPLDDFTRVFNCRSSNGSPASVKSRIETACGKGAVSYIENFIKDVNGGVHASATPTVMNKALSLFKKGAVFASASVAIQQPSAIARALAEVDTKYFAKTTFTKRDYDELIKYAPIARVKSMGFFDNSIGQSTKEWLLSREYKGAKNKAAALLKDSSFRDDVLSKAPEKMDEITWCHLWNAVKAETADKYKLSGEELLKKSGERFAEVVELTQVYDSVFSKSEYMRSKDTGAKMSMAFMAEPTTALNMLVDAAANLKHGDKKQGGRYIGAFVASVIFNNILKTLVTAARDDDEEKTLVEKYISSVAGGIVNDLNPLTLLPWVKDVLSIFNGYSIERADMSLVQDLYNAVNSLGSDKKSSYRKVEDTAGALAAFLGLPVKNVMRDFRAAYNVCAGIFGFQKENEEGEKVSVQKNIKDTSGEGIKKALKDEFSEGFLNKVKNFVEETFFGAADEQLYNAIKQGNYKAYEKLLKEEYESDSEKVNSAIRNGLVEYDERVTQAAEARRDGNATLYGQCVKGLSADGFSNENIRKSVDKVYNKLMDDGEEGSTDKAYSLYTYEDLNNAIETGGAVQTVIDDIVSAAVQNGKTEETAKENIRNQVTSYWKPLYLEASEYEQEEIKELLDGTNLYNDLDETLYKWELSYTTEKYKTLYVESSQSEKQRIISELEATGLYDDAEKTAKGWEVSVLKEEYKSATSPTEKERIKAEIWNTGYYKYYSNMSKALDKLDSDE